MSKEQEIKRAIETLVASVRTVMRVIPGRELSLEDLTDMVQKELRIVSEQEAKNIVVIANSLLNSLGHSYTFEWDYKDPGQKSL